MRGHASRPSGSNTTGSALYSVPRTGQAGTAYARNPELAVPPQLLHQQPQVVPAPVNLAGLVLPTEVGGTNELTFPLGLNLNGYSPEQQETIRTFLQAVGIAELETDNLLAPPPQRGDPSVLGPGDVNVEIEYHQRGRDRERERLLPERIQAMNVADRAHVPAAGSSTSTSRSPGDGSTADMEMSEDDGMEVID